MRDLPELENLAEECAHENWDGYGAAPVSSNTILNAAKVVKAIPEGIPIPSLSAEPDGHVTLEWCFPPSRIMSISVAPNGSLHYAAMIDENRTYGTEVFSGAVPEVITELINLVIGGEYFPKISASEPQ